MSCLHHTTYCSGALIDAKYRLLRSLGEGAMAWIWLARHETLGVPVALKIMKPGSAAGALDEARTTAGLRHPSIVSVFDFGRTALGDAFFVMEHLEGSPLSDVLERDGRLPAVAATRLLLPLLDALHLCHERGVVHRDLKPSNIFLARLRGRTQAKLLDFGIAKPLAGACGGTELAGTPGYMAPEQAHGMLDVDQRADLWAFCAVLYECVAGRPAIQGRTCMALLTASAEPEIAPLYEPDGRVSSLWPVLERGLRKHPGERFPVASALRGALIDWLDGGGAGRVRNGSFGHVGSAARRRPARERRHVQWRELPRAS